MTTFYFDPIFLEVGFQKATLKLTFYFVGEER